MHEFLDKLFWRNDEDDDLGEEKEDGDDGSSYSFEGDAPGSGGDGDPFRAEPVHKSGPKFSFTDADLEFIGFNATQREQIRGGSPFMLGESGYRRRDSLSFPSGPALVPTGDKPKGHIRLPWYYTSRDPGVFHRGSRNQQSRPSYATGTGIATKATKIRYLTLPTGDQLRS